MSKELFEVTPEQAKEWREREKARLADGTYTNVPSGWIYNNWFVDQNKKEITWPDGTRWYPPRYPDHFAHISVDKVATIAFTESEQKGMRDRQTRINPGKYLTRFFSEWLSPSDIQSLATQMGADYNDDAELCFAKTADEIEDVYLKGPRSCMSHPTSQFSSPVHPTRVYAGFDLELAYLKRNGGITARALVWPEKKIYSRLYGDEVRLQTMLGRNGYEYNPSGFDGAKITKLMHNDAYVVPYFDHLDGAQDAGGHLILRADSSRSLCCDGDCQNGLSEEHYRCESCGENLGEDGGYHDDDSDQYCHSCWSENRWQCDYSGEWIYSDSESPTDVRTSVRTRNDVTTYNTEMWCEDSANRRAFYCDRDEVYYHNGHFRSVTVGDEMWGPAAVERDAVMIDGVWHDRDDAPTEQTEPYGPHYMPAPAVQEQEIVVGCLVTCLTEVKGYFTIGKQYKVTAVYMKDTTPRISVEANDRGENDGWCTEHFRFHSMPEQRIGLHIRHEPEREFPYQLYDGERRLDSWRQREVAENRMARMLAERQPPQRSILDAPAPHYWVDEARYINPLQWANAVPLRNDELTSYIPYPATRNT